jgi:putative ABC transport system permease protein
VLGAGVGGFAALLMAVSSDAKLGAIAVGGFAAAGLVFALLAWLVVKLLQRAVPETGAPRWLVLATRQIAARPAFAVLQVSALAVGLLALVLLVLLRTDLISSWRQATPPDAPNRFVINLQPDQGEAFRGVLAQAGVTRYDWFPMIRGRLVAINGRTITPESFEDDGAQRMIDREFNLSHRREAAGPQRSERGPLDPRRGRRAVGGRRTGADAGTEAGRHAALRHRRTAARGPHHQPAQGRLALDAGQLLRAVPRVAAHADLPITYISAFKAPATPGFDNRLSRDFPNITNVDVSASIGQVQRVLDQVIRAVEFLFGFTLAAGLVVLFAAITATREARSREFAIMRAMGASGRLLAQVQRTELLGVGALAGTLASVAALGVGWALARYAFQFDWNPSPWVPLFGGAAGALLALGAGWWGLREVLRRPVLETLRRAGAV